MFWAWGLLGGKKTSGGAYSISPLLSKMY